MILNRLFGKLHFNWKYALGEVALIFIGITLSLTFDEWRAARAGKQLERELLIELKEAMKRDTANLSYQIKVCKKLIRHMDYIKNNLRKSKSLTDSLSYSLAWINTSAGFQADYSAYQGLMAMGIVTISSASLRHDVIGYYNEADRLKDWNSSLIKRLDSFIAPFLMKEFDEFNREQNVVPVDFNRLKSNHEFLYFIGKSHELYSVTLIGLESHRSLVLGFLQKLP